MGVPKFKTSVDIVGNLDKFVERAQKRLNEDIGPVLAEHAEKVLATAQSLVPVDEGVLRDSLHIKGKGNFTSVRTDARKAPHGHLVHFGTAKMAGRPFLYQAADRHKDELKPAIKKILGQD